MKTLVLYVFHEYNNRVEHFLKNCLFQEENTDFIIISNNKNFNTQIPNVMMLTRENIGYDFGGWSEALLTHQLYQNYDTFIFVNSSVMGPYLPSYYKGKWTDIYLDGLKDNVKLFGSTINTVGNPLSSHVQSYIFSMDKTTLQYLMDCEIFSLTNHAPTFNDAIWNKEVLMSRKIIENKWNIGSLLPYYKGVDFTNPVFEKPCLNDIMYPPFRNTLWSEYELVFIKGNRVHI
jgi:lipopolysaccharide biosynthesis protein